MENGIHASEARLRSKVALESITIEEPADMSERIEERLRILARKQLNSVNVAIEQALSSESGVSNMRYVYSFELKDPTYKDDYAALMQEVAQRVCDHLQQNGFTAEASEAHIHESLRDQLNASPVRINITILVGWA